MSERPNEPPRPEDLAIVTNSFNRRILLERAIKSLYDHLRPIPAEVIVVDDGSTDGSAELIEAWARDGQHPGLRLVRPPKRVAFAGGVNLGIQVSQAPYICLFETDNVANDAGLWQGVSYLKAHPEVGAVGFRVTLLDGTTAGNSMSFPSAIAFLFGQQIAHRFGLERPSSGVSRDVVFTSPLVISRAAIARVGLMNDVTFPFGDSDIDWCRRFHDAGFDLHVLEDVAVVHDQGGHKSEFSKTRTLDFHRARLAYFKRYEPRVVPLLRIGLLARHCVELGLLGAARALGKVPPDRVQTRIELLKRWPRDYEAAR
jgi:GT2 family glycosyltransferase